VALITVEDGRLDDPVVTGFIDLVQAEYVVRYGGPDEAPIDPAEFVPPAGRLLVASLDGVPAGCGGWRALGDGRAEVKRMFTVAEFRNRGVARALLAGLERTAAEAGITDLVLETGVVQPEAIALYVSSGYERIDGFGHYAGMPLSRAFGKHLGAGV
jgi:GNAT superfamily N-acetyltransferase